MGRRGQPVCWADAAAWDPSGRIFGTESRTATAGPERYKPHPTIQARTRQACGRDYACTSNSRERDPSGDANDVADATLCSLVSYRRLCRIRCYAKPHWRFQERGFATGGRLQGHLATWGTPFHASFRTTAGRSRAGSRTYEPYWGSSRIASESAMM
jgi:hypothetical protein